MDPESYSQGLTHYEVLQVPQDASELEIRDAYFRLRSVFDKKNDASYSLLGTDEVQANTKAAEQAFLVLSNPSKRRSYDAVLASEGKGVSADSASDEVSAPSPVDTEWLAQELLENCESPDILKKIRDHLGVSVEHLQAVTKVSLRFLSALEENDFGCLPQAVYTKGFIKAYLDCLRVPRERQSDIVEPYMKRLKAWEEKRDV